MFGTIESFCTRFKFNADMKLSCTGCERLLRLLKLREVSYRPSSTMVKPREVRVRFAPSPTGQIHLGGLRTALYNYVFAKSQGGKFLLRIEDTDQSRLVIGALQNIENVLQWAGLTPDEGPSQGGAFGPYIQSERLSIYKEHADYLLKKEAAYHCFCSQQRLNLLRKEAMRKKETPKYDNRCRHLTPQQVQDKLEQGHKFVIRFKLEDSSVTFTDLVYGLLQQQPALVEGDPVIIKADGFPVYHFANVVDDHCMQISHVLRGLEWLTSVGKHIQLYKAFDWTIPQFAHLPLLMNKDGTKLSKRQNDISVDYLQKAGHVPKIILNLITFCGSGFEDNRKIRTLSQMIQEFELDRVSQHSAVLDMDMLNYISQQEIRTKCENPEGMSKLANEVHWLVKDKYPDSVSENPHIVEDHYLQNIIKVRKFHINRLSELVSDSYRYLWVSPNVRLQDLQSFSQHPEKVLDFLYQKLQGIDDDCWNEDQLKTELKSLKKLKNDDFPPFPQIMKIMRLSLTGLKEGPAIVEILEMLMKSEVLKRIEKMLDTSISR
ncbi:nondiscriminating glutamyl-tRNA synthetase EARS2, mitochondrial-like [Ptychodera flava]|uniref:nondiscriminating glutamyl-tRNA synthetase EARS2, mitochondrial-like n=1 Tax=Ptychodera flava TaxID=63121 RepID=UPI00396A2459